MLGYVSVHGKNYHFLKMLYYILLLFLPVHSNWMEPGVNNPGANLMSVHSSFTVKHHYTN